MPEGVTVIHGDCLEVMAGMESGSVDAVITDPPYGTGNWQRGRKRAGSDPTAKKTIQSWDRFNLTWVEDALRISRGPVVFFVPATQLPSAFNLASRLELSWRLLIWCKADPKPRPGGQTAWGMEPILALRATFDRGDKDYCVASAPRLGRDFEAVGHPHQKPLSVMRWLISLVVREGGTILDPFMGGGTTGLAAIRLGRSFVGIEREGDYFEIARGRLDGPLLPLFDDEFTADSTPLFAGLTEP